MMVMIANIIFPGGMAQGGRFEHGFFSGFVSSLGGSYMMGIENAGVQVVMSAAIGGTAEALGGGKFANGAVTGAYVMMFNHLLDHGDGLPEPDGVDAISGAAIDKYGPIHEYHGMTEDAFLSLSLEDQQRMTAQAKFYIDNYGDKTGWDYQRLRTEQASRLDAINRRPDKLQGLLTYSSMVLDFLGFSKGLPVIQTIIDSPKNNHKNKNQDFH